MSDHRGAHHNGQCNKIRGMSATTGLLSVALVLAMAASPLVASPQAPAGPPPPPPATAPTQTTPPGQPQQTGQPGQPGPTDPTPSPSQTNPSTPNPKPDVSQQPIPQKQNPDVKAGSKDDVDAIGNRGVGNGVNFYSLEREIALGKGLAQEVERSAKLVDDPVVSEYVNRVGQNIVRNSDAKVPFTF